MKYVIDIDGTICTASRDGTYKDAYPIQHRIDMINSLYDKGNEIVYFSARGMNRCNGDAEHAYVLFSSMTLDQLHSWGCKFNSFIMGKPSADVYIDDKGVNANEFFR